MTHTSVAASADKVGAQQKDVYQMVTDIIIERLEQGVIPWKKPWGSDEMGPRNYESQRPYRGINAMILSGIFEHPQYLTFNQVKALGGAVIKGSKSMPVFYFDMIYRLRATGEKITHEEALQLPVTQYTSKPFLRYYNVFNISQVKGIDFKLPEPVQFDRVKVLENCQALVDGMPYPPKMTQVGNEAYYVPAQDRVNMPKPKSFHSSEAYHAALFHELIHSTGHSQRLARPEIVNGTKFGSSDYSKEELVAELGACFLMSYAGSLEDFILENATAYIQDWLTILKNEPRWVMEASAKASKATQYILGA